MLLDAEDLFDAAGSSDPNTYFIGEEQDLSAYDLPLVTETEGLYPVCPPIPENAVLPFMPLEFGSLPRGIKLDTIAPGSPSSTLLESALPSGATSPTESVGGPAVPRVCSMPNLVGGTPFLSSALRRRAAANRVMSRSKSDGHINDMDGLKVPHQQFLTPPHMRKGKGGRQPAQDPRLDPRIDPKKAKRILANRLSAAKSKLKQKSQMDALRQKMDVLKVQRNSLSDEAEGYMKACAEEAEKRRFLMENVASLESQLMMRRQNLVLV